MARFYNIEKNGIATVIDEYQYESIYKPKGWKIVSVAGGEPDAVPTSPRDEQTIKNVNRMKRASKNREFDDNLIKGE